jgi:hypothetical protein
MWINNNTTYYNTTSRWANSLGRGSWQSELFSSSLTFFFGSIAKSFYFVRVQPYRTNHWRWELHLSAAACTTAQQLLTHSLKLVPGSNHKVV